MVNVLHLKKMHNTVLMLLTEKWVYDENLQFKGVYMKTWSLMLLIP